MPAARPRLRLLLLWLPLLAALLLPVRVRAQTWVDSLRLGTEVRFLYSNEVHRYDLGTRTWLPAVTLPRTGATAMAWDAQNCYIAYGAVIYSYAATLLGEAPFASASTSVHSLFVDGNLLLAVHSASTTSKVTSWNRTTRAQLSTKDTSTWSLFGSSHAPGLNRIFGRSQLISPPDVSYSAYTTAGVISATVDSPNHGDYPDATRTWVSGDEVRVYDTSGTVYTTAGLTYVGSLGGTITDVAFNSDVPIVIRNNSIIAYKNNLLEAGRKTLGFSTGAEVQLDATNAYVFRPGTPDPGVEIVPLTAINAPAPNQPLDATGLAFQPHTVFKDKDGIIGLYSVNHQAVFRWSPASRAYVAPLMLPAQPVTYMTYSEANHRIYSGYQTAIRQTNAVPGAATTTFATTPEVLYGLTAFESYIYTSYLTGTRCYTAAGTAVNDAGNYGGTANAWDPVKRRMYHFEDELLDAFLVYEVIGTDGRITSTGRWPNGTNYNRSFPIRVSPDGTTLVTGEGVVFGTTGLTLVTDINVNMTDMLWYHGAFVSIENGGTSITRLQRWSAAWQRQQSLLLKGSPLRLLPLSASELLVITMDGGIPRYHILNDEYEPQYDSVNEAPAVVTQPVGAEVDYRTAWTFTVEAAGSPELRYQWLKNNVPIEGATAPVLALTELGSADTGEYKARVTNGFGTVTSNGAVLFVGPVTPGVYTAGNLLVSSGRRLFEYTPAGVQVSSINIPVPTANTPSSHIVADAVVDRFGRLQVLNEGRTPANVAQYFLSTFDPRRQLWAHRSIGNLGNLADAAQRDMATAGDWIYERYYRVNLTTSVVIRNEFPFTDSIDELSTGLDGKLYTVNSSNSVVRRLNTDLTPAGMWDLGSIAITGIAGDATGKYYVCDSSSRLASYGSGGGQLKSYTPPGTFSGFVDISVSPAGRIAAGDTSGLVAVTDTNLTTSITINPGTSAMSYTSWVPAVAQPAPSLVNTIAPAAATEDILYQWTPAVEHPDPDAVITLTAPVKPVWVTVSNGMLSGTPLQAHVGPNAVRLRATDAAGAFVERDFVINVIEVNDTPAGTNQAVAVDEDAAPVLVDLTALFLDEETPAAALTYQIVSTTGTTAVPSLQGTGLRLTFPADANGDASVTVRATDAGGLTADAVISIAVRPVNDAPGFPSLLPDISAGAAAPDAAIDLAPLLRDPDAGDTHTWRIAAVSNPDIFTSLTVDAAGRLAIRYAPYRSGSSDVTVELRDAAGETATLTVKITLPELPAPQVAVNAALVLNRQTGLWEHRITVRNDALRDIGGFEVRVSGLPAGACLYNASECSAAVQLAGYYSPIAPGASVTMVLEYYHPARAALNPVLTVNTTLPQPPPPAGAGGLAVDRVTAVPGGMLLEFSAVPGHLYLVQYSDNGEVWFDSLVRIRAAGTRVQWLDQGPPRTHSAPGPGGQRFYRVKEVAGP